MFSVYVEQWRVYLRLLWAADQTVLAITDEILKHFHDACLDDWRTSWSPCAQTRLLNIGMYNCILLKVVSIHYVTMY